jgi:hypothetical protein
MKPPEVQMAELSAEGRAREVLERGHRLDWFKTSHTDLWDWAMEARAMLAFRNEPTAALDGGTVEACARVAVDAAFHYREPTDWDYGAQDACTKIERAILDLIRRGGQPL